MPERLPRLSLTDRAIVRAVADAEGEGERWLDHEPPEDPLPENDDAALTERSRRIARQIGLDTEVRKTLATLRLLWPATALLGVLAGAGAAWAGLAGGGDPTTPEAADLNVLWFLQATLGLHTLFLLIALAAIALAIVGAGHPLLALARATAMRLARAARPGSVGSGARATALTVFGGRRGAFTAGAIGHAAGLGFVAGAVLALVVAASFREQYRFFWKSTLLSDRQAAGLIDAVAAGPRALGIPSPQREEIARARADSGPAGGAETAEWAWMLIGALVVWGALPRTAALGACLLGARAMTRAAPLAVSASYRQRALERARRVPPGEPPDQTPASPAVAPEPPPREDDDRPLGAPVVLGYEIDPDGVWPPPGLSRCEDLGLIDGAADRRRVLTQLDDAPTRPRALVAFFSRGETPALAERAFLGHLVARAGERAAVVLTLSRTLATERTERDAERIGHRTELWRRAALEAGVPADRIAEIDLRHITPTTEAHLRSLAGETHGTPSTPGSGAFVRALDDIEDWADRGDGSPKAVAELLKRIETRFDATPGWRRAVRAVSSGDIKAAGGMAADSARSLGRMLPSWMPRHAGWMTAAATLATTGTVSAVLLAGGPVGVVAGAWPVYAAAGAALGEVFGRGADAVRPEPPRDEDAVVAGARAGVLHALVLALQGQPDERIASTIDSVLDGAPDVASASEVGRLTGHVRARAADLPVFEGSSG